MEPEERDISLRLSSLQANLTSLYAWWTEKNESNHSLNTMMSWRQEYASRCNDPFLSQKRIWLLTFSLSAVFLKSVIKYSMTAKNMIKWKQYMAVLIIFSTVCPRYDQHGQATLVPRTYDAVTATELYTVIPVRQLRSWNKLLRSPGPTEALIIEASFCVFVHLDPHFGFQIPNEYNIRLRASA